MWKRLVAGFGGAIALNALHRVLKDRIKGVPEFHEVSEEVIDKSLQKVNLKVLDSEKLYNATLAGDVLSNGLYYSFTPFKLNTMIGAIGGLGALKLPKKIGLNDAPIADTNQKKLMILGYYIFGALVAGGIYQMLTYPERRKKRLEEAE